MPIGEIVEGVALTDNAAGYNEIGLCCPVCGETYVHFDGKQTVPCELNFRGECGHRWLIAFDFHKGALFVTSTRLFDDSQDFTNDDDGEEIRIEATPRSALPKMLRWYIIEKFNYTCQYCKRQHQSSKAGPDGRPWHIDHIVPLALGGVDGPENLTLSCERCNLRKHAKRPGEFRP